jgi:predicted transcriptional regulator
VANSQDDSFSQHPEDLLAAVVLHTLLNQAHEGMSVEAVAVACERDPDEQRDIEEIEASLAILLEDGLAEREGRTSRQGLYRATRAAIRANELSF